jgi:DNA-binding IclR family transcriptional regulator
MSVQLPTDVYSEQFDFVELVRDVTTSIESQAAVDIVRPRVQQRSVETAHTCRSCQYQDRESVDVGHSSSREVLQVRRVNTQQSLRLTGEYQGAV